MNKDEKKDFILVMIFCLFLLGMGLWGYFGKWFPHSPQEIAQQRGIVIGQIERKSQEGVITAIFDNENIGRKRIDIYPGSWELTFVPDKSNYIQLFFENRGVKGCEKLSDEELIRRHLKKIEVHYSE